MWMKWNSSWIPLLQKEKKHRQWCFFLHEDIIHITWEGADWLCSWKRCRVNLRIKALLLFHLHSVRFYCFPVSTVQRGWTWSKLAKTRWFSKAEWLCLLILSSKHLRLGVIGYPRVISGNYSELLKSAMYRWLPCSCYCNDWTSSNATKPSSKESQPDIFSDITTIIISMLLHCDLPIFGGLVAYRKVP